MPRRPTCQTKSSTAKVNTGQGTVTPNSASKM
jgi:hypothetical protein